MDTDQVPVFSFQDVNKDRFKKVEEVFKNLYKNINLEFFVRAPGRVNLIGEHVDYSGYPVLPMAIDQDSVLAVGIDQTGDTCTISNVFSDKFPPETFPIDPERLKIDETAHSWVNFVKCGYKGVQDWPSSLAPPVAFRAVVDGQVPMGSGLSSSSALVCASALATMRAQRRNISKKDMAEVCQKCERYVGTCGGGMDQAISFLAKSGSASLIYFNPVSTLNLTLPDDCVFFVANSLVESTKIITADTCYNMRVVECRLAAKLLAKSLGFDWNKVSILKQVQEAGKFTLDDMINHTKTHLHETPYTRPEIAKILGIPESTLTEPTFIGNKVKSLEFRLHPRALHVFLESKLVLEFSEICQNSSENGKSQKLGSLMNESHRSCRDNFDCSCPDLDLLTEICRSAGAFGSRLTGAGWGGCTVSLVPKIATVTFFETVKRGYFEKKFPELIQQNGIGNYLFETSPGQGAFILEP